MKHPVIGPMGLDPFPGVSRGGAGGTPAFLNGFHDPSFAPRAHTVFPGVPGDGTSAFVY